MKVLVGTCGFPKARRVIYETLDAVELQGTFYNMPRREKMAELRREAPEFHITAKVFQGITHPPESPTFKRTRGFKPGEGHGLLKPTRENLQLWEEFKKAVTPLRPEVLVFQTPPGLKPSPHIYEFFSSIAGSWRLAWEPRGETHRDPDLMRGVASLGIMIVVDPLKRDPPPADAYYFRLHGLGKGEVNYRYGYTEEDLRRIAVAIRRLQVSVIYIMFNNVYMYDDAVALKQIMSRVQPDS